MIPGIVAQGAGGAGGPPAGWSPLSLPSLYAWFDASQQPEADLATITTLSDLSGNARHFTNRGGVHTGPFLKHAELDSKPVIVWGSNTAESGAVATALDRADAGFLTGLSSAAMMVLVKARTDPASGGTDGGFQGRMHNHGGDVHVPYGDGNCYTGFGSTTRYTFNPSPSLANWHLWYEESQGGAGGYKNFINGVNIYTGGSNTVGWSTGDYKYLGRGNSGGASGTYRGRMAEIIFFDSVPSSGEREEAEGGILWKWGLEALLPVGHPYESAGP